MEAATVKQVPGDPSVQVTASREQLSDPVGAAVSVMASWRTWPDDARDRLEAISVLTDGRIESLDVDDLLDELLARVVGLLKADTAAILLLDAGSQRLVARSAWGIEEEVRQGVRVEV